jgi:molybdenum cofactor synthesis domain-containing protein
MRVAIVTVSDTAARGEREDRSGPAVVERCRKLGFELAGTHMVADDLEALGALLIRLAGTVDVVLTTGGTGIGPRDITPEATVAVGERVVPGLGERMRAVGGAGFPKAYLARQTAVVRGSTLIVNLPGSPKGAVESLDAVAELLPHAVEVLKGARHD